MWEKEIWIAKRKSAEINEYGVEIETFEKPIKYAMNYQPVSGYTDYAVYGDKMRDTYRAFVNRLEYQNVINVGDRVYLSDGQLAESELEKIDGVLKVNKTSFKYEVEIKDEKYFKNIFNYIKTKNNITKFVLEDASLEEIFIAKVGEVYGK